MNSSDSHSCGVHGCPNQVKLNGSVVGTVPVSAISCPVVMCQKKSGSWTPLVTVMANITPPSAIARIATGEGSHRSGVAAESAAGAREDSADIAGSLVVALMHRNGTEVPRRL